MISSAIELAVRFVEPLPMSQIMPVVTPSILKMNSMVVLKELSTCQKVQDGLYMVEKASI